MTQRHRDVQIPLQYLFYALKHRIDPFCVSIGTISWDANSSLWLYESGSNHRRSLSPVGVGCNHPAIVTGDSLLFSIALLQSHQAEREFGLDIHQTNN